MAVGFLGCVSVVGDFAGALCYELLSWGTVGEGTMDGWMMMMEGQPRVLHASGQPGDISASPDSRNTVGNVSILTSERLGVCLHNESHLQSRHG